MSIYWFKIIRLLKYFLSPLFYYYYNIIIRILFVMFLFLRQLLLFLILNMI